MKRRTILSIFLSAAVLAGGGAQTASAGLSSAKGIRTAGEGIAAEEFRRGVQAYYRGAYNEAILQFERALAYMPDDNLILNWMGKAYFHSGMEGIALNEWKRALENGYGGLLLENKMEAVRERRIMPEFSGNEIRYTDAGSFPGVFNGNLIFSGPSAVLPNSDGSVWIAAYGSNELLLMNANGTVVRRVTGPLNGFDRPLDVIRLSDGNLLVSESAGGRLSLLDKKGRFLSYIGSKGRGVGGLVGPQRLAQDGRKNIYVSDYGNCRVDVFDKDGKALFFFGGRTDGFDGLKGPTGIAVSGGSVFVADDVDGCIYEFDLAGNYRRMLVEERTFRRPEAMKVWNGFLIVCDTNKVLSVDLDSGAVYENASIGNAPSRLTSAVPDVNGNILVSDFKSNEVYAMSKMQELVGGLFVQIERVNSDAFPEVFVEVSVSGRRGNPIVGLREENFYFTEGSRPVSDVKFLGAASMNEVADIAIVIDRSASTARHSQQVDSVVRELSAAMNGAGTLRIISAGRVPAVEYVGSPGGAVQFDSSGLKTPVSSIVPVDLALRLAANDLVNGEKKRAIVFVSAGKVTQNSFDKYSLAETVAFLNNNFVSCASVSVSQNASDAELSYIVRSTYGGEYYVFREEGLSGVVGDILDIPIGLYGFSYTSALGTNFGEAYLPLEVETYFLNRSGRDEAGYFAPLQ